MKNNMKYYTSKDIWKHFYRLTKDKRIYILMEALSYMQQYNGRTAMHCIALAMGYDNTEGDNKSYFKR